MPTGYTIKIEDGSIKTGKEFLSLCCRAFNVCVMMKEDSLDKPTPKEFGIDPFYEEQIEQLKKDLEKAENITIEEAEEMLKEDQRQTEDYVSKKVLEEKHNLEKYNAIESEILAWTPPTPEHENLKKFALEQVRVSKPKENDFKYYREMVESINSLTPEEYKQRRINILKESLQRAIENYEEHVEAISDKNRWLKEFWESFEEE